jgi:hypothetical protein
MASENGTSEPSRNDLKSAGRGDGHRELYFMTGDRIPGHRAIDSNWKSLPSGFRKSWVAIADPKTQDRANDSEQPETR